MTVFSSLRLRRPMILSAVLGAGFLSACGPPEAPPPEMPEIPPPKIVFLISLDTFRADLLGKPHRDLPSLTPALDAFAQDAARFHRAYAPMSFTLPSHMTMLTGLSPDVHGVHGEKKKLNPQLHTLPELLQEQGFRNFGFVTNDWMKGSFGFDRGFERYDKLQTRLTFADRVNGRVFEVLDQIAAEAAEAGTEQPPAFFFLNYYDAHSDFSQFENRLPYFSERAKNSEEFAVLEEMFCNESGECATQFLLSADRQDSDLPEEVVAKVEELYLDGIPELDQQIGLLFDDLRRRGLYDESLIIVTSDHGEEFREHGLFIHSQIYQETVGVPMLIKFPDAHYAGSESEALVRHTDLLPTIAEAVGFSAPDYVQGRSLISVLEGTAEDEAEILALSQDKHYRDRYALRQGDHLLVYDFSDETAELYDVAADPGELNDLSGEQSDTVRNLLRKLAQRQREDRETAKLLAALETGEGLTPEERARLKDLGYLSD